MLEQICETAERSYRFESGRLRRRFGGLVSRRCAEQALSRLKSTARLKAIGEMRRRVRFSGARRDLSEAKSRALGRGDGVNVDADYNAGTDPLRNSLRIRQTSTHRANTKAILSRDGRACHLSTTFEGTYRNGLLAGRREGMVSEEITLIEHVPNVNWRTFEGGS